MLHKHIVSLLEYGLFEEQANEMSGPGKDSSKYDRANHPNLSALVAGTEAQHAASTHPIEVSLHGLTLEVDPGVFNPALSNVGDLLAAQMNIRDGEVVLDLGTGSGFQALVAARKASKVVASDSQMRACTCAKKNIDRYQLSQKIQVLCGDLFDPITADIKFDTILFNFPFVPWKAESDWQKANFDEGHANLKRFLEQAPNHLQLSGRILMTWSDVGDTQYFFGLAEQYGYKIRSIAEREAKGIKHYVIELTV